MTSSAASNSACFDMVGLLAEADNAVPHKYISAVQGCTKMVLNSQILTQAMHILEKWGPLRLYTHQPLQSVHYVH